MKRLNRIRKRSVAAVLSLSLLVAGTCSFSAQANFLDDAKKKLSELGGHAGKFIDEAGRFLEDKGITPALKHGYDTAVDFVFNYETQPDDADMESLARSWAVTAWLGDEDRQETNIYYFDNHTLNMVEDPTLIGHGYNLKKTPEGSSLNEKHSGILRAIVISAANYTVEWVNYDDELNSYLMRKMKEKKAAEEAETTETG